MKLKEIGKNSLICLGTLGGVQSMSITKNGQNSRSSLDKGKCINIPQQFIEYIARENEIDIIKGNKDKLELLSNDEQKRFYDEKYYEVMSKNWSNFLLENERVNSKKDIDSTLGDIKNCVKYKFFDIKESKEEDPSWLKVAENIANNNENLIVPLSKPMLPGLKELNKIYTESYLNDTIAYISLDEYNKCVEKKINKLCGSGISWKSILTILGVAGVIGTAITKLDEQEKVDKVINSFIRGYRNFNEALDRCINYFSKKIIGRDVIETETESEIYDFESVVSEDRTIGANNVEEIDITNYDNNSEITMFK